MSPGSVRRWCSVDAMRAFSKTRLNLFQELIQVDQIYMFLWLVWILFTKHRKILHEECSELGGKLISEGRFLVISNLTQGWSREGTFKHPYLWLNLEHPSHVSSESFHLKTKKYCYCCCGSKLLIRSTWKWNLCFAIQKKLPCRRLPPMNFSIIPARVVNMKIWLSNQYTDTLTFLFVVVTPIPLRISFKSPIWRLGVENSSLSALKGPKLDVSVPNLSGFCSKSSPIDGERCANNKSIGTELVLRLSH